MENSEITFYPVPGYADLFEVNESGTHVKIKQHIRWTNGYRKTFRTIPEKIITDIPATDRYRAFMKYINGKHYHICVHVLVCLAFHPNPENKPEVNHKDTNKLNNHKDNVEWSTRPENAAHAKLNKLYPSIENKRWHAADRSKHCKGEKHRCTNLKKAHILLIRSSPFNGRELAEHYGMTESSINKIRRFESWKHIK